MSGLSNTVQREASASVSSGLLSRVVYRSRAVGTVTPPDLHQLTEAAKARNEREAVTGVMLYDDRRYFQWLEGPADGVDRIMGSIRNDRRHTDLEVLSTQSAPARTFGGWSMKLATPGPAFQGFDAVLHPRDVIDPPREIVETLRRQPEAAPVLLVKLLGSTTETPSPDAAMSDAMAHLPLQAKIAAILKGVMLSTVIPSLAHDTRLPIRLDRVPPPHPRANELADLLIGPDPVAAMEMIHQLNGGSAPLASLYAKLFEPAARILGDMWGEDTCSEFDVTLGLCRLQAAIRMLGASPHATPGRTDRPVVLITPEPGELHRLGATLDSDVLQNAGWTPRIAYPTDDKSLADLVSNDWIDVLDLSLSPAFRRDHRLAGMTETIVQARRASKNPALMVVVGGRVFFERGTDADAVGANVATRTAVLVDQVIMRNIATATQVEDLVPLVTPS